MSKINLNASLVSEDDNLNIITAGIKTKNKIVYKENSISVTIIISNNKIEMNRKCNEYEINLLFINNCKTTSTYTVFGANKVFDLNTITKKLIINDDEIIIDYELEGNSFLYKLKLGGIYDN